jgi:hypothetical protein
MTCDEKASAAKRAWALGSHSDLANVFHKEGFDIGDTWCRIWETTGTDREYKAGDFGRTLFTGEGLHPSVSSSLVPGSGFAGGASFSLGQNLSGAHRMRLSESVDGRFSTNRSWSFTSRLDMLGSGSRVDNRHNNATLEVERQQLAQLTYFGQGNSSSLNAKSVFALSRAVAGGAMEVPLPQGFFISVQLAGLWLRPFGVHDASVASIEDRFPAATETPPAIGTATTYFVYGGGIRWKHPIDAVTSGYATELGATIREYRETHGLPFSFALLDLAWTNRYAPSERVGSFSLAALASLSFVPVGDAAPFYLQSTVGGTDLSGVSVLRSFNDYRFRAPNRLATLVEHEHDIIGPLGSLMFVDWGGVSQNASSFDLRRFHRSFGAGLTIRMGNVTVLRAFYAWGGGEGTRTTFNGTSDNFASVLRTRTLF